MLTRSPDPGQPVLDRMADPTAMPLQSIDTLAAPALVVAPHPDDECLGCGGVVALLRQAGYPVQILVISDGTMSHPNSVKFPAPVLQMIREAETQAAMRILGVDPEQITFLRLPDGAVPQVDAPEFAAAEQQCRQVFQQFLQQVFLQQVLPQSQQSQSDRALLFLPWRSDPHPDHRASWQLMQAALRQVSQPSESADLSKSAGLLKSADLLESANRQTGKRLRVLEYPIWDWDRTQRGIIPDQVSAWRLAIDAVVEQKQQAIQAYRSQISDLIDDDPLGFRLSPEMLQNFAQPWEVYFEAKV